LYRGRSMFVVEQNMIGSDVIQAAASVDGEEQSIRRGLKESDGWKFVQYMFPRASPKHTVKQGPDNPVIYIYIYKQIERGRGMAIRLFN
jgi:hypothetical protein